VRTGHGENVRSSINQRSGQRLAAQVAYVCAFLCTDFHRIHAWRLTTNRVHAGRCDFNVLPVASQSSKKPFCDRAPTNVACADEENVFHGSERAANAFGNLEANLSKVNFRWSRSVILAVICRFSRPRIAVIVTTVHRFPANERRDAASCAIV